MLRVDPHQKGPLADIIASLRDRISVFEWLAPSECDGDQDWPWYAPTIGV